MTYKMEGSSENQATKDNLIEAAGTAPGKKLDEHLNDDDRFPRERNLLLLSAIYNLYGTECEQSPDWMKVAEEIENAKIPIYGDNFSPEACQRLYDSLINFGYNVGIGTYSEVLKTPRRLNEAEKRLWILAKTSTDIVRTSKKMDEAMRILYKQQLEEIENISSANCDIKSQTVAKALEVPVDVESDDELSQEEYDDPETEKYAAELGQSEVMQKITGLNDVLLFAKYCNDAAEYAVKNCPPLNGTKKTQPVNCQDAPPTKLENIPDLTISIVPTNIDSEEIKVLAETEKTCNDEHQDTNPPASSLDAAKILFEPPDSTLETPTPEIPPIKLHEGSPGKVSSRRNSDDNDQFTLEVKSEICASPSPPGSPKGNGEESVSVPNSLPKTQMVPDSNGQIDDVETTKGPSKDEPIKEKFEVESSKSSNKIQNVEKTHEKDLEPITGGDLPKINATITTDGDNAIADDSEATTTSESSEVNETVESSRHNDSVAKGKQGKKGSSTARPISTRTSSRLVTPEPNDQVQNDDEKKKPHSRQTSSSEGHTPTLRSRRGTTPTKAVQGENDSGKSTSTSKPSLPQAEDNEETFETPRSTPESNELKSDLEPSTKPPKQLKVYSAKPPSPLSQVDPELLNEFDEEEDAELAEINSHANKANKGYRSSPTKSSSLRGRTVSTENPSDTGIIDESTFNRRITRRAGLNDDGDEGEGNNEEGGSKRLTRRSLKLHDAANEESTEAPQTESDKAASESSYGGKEKKPKTPKSAIRVKKPHDEKNRVYVEGDSDVTPDGKRLTRAQAKTSISQPEKRSKPPSVGDTEGLSESEPAPTRATRSRSSTASNMPVLEPTTQPQTTQSHEDEEQKIFRMNALNLYEKLVGSEPYTNVQKHLAEDQSKEWNANLSKLKYKIETGKIPNIVNFHKEMNIIIVGILFDMPNSTPAKESFVSIHKMFLTCLQDFKTQPSAPLQKNDNSDVESLESRDEQRSETSSKQTSGGGRRKRKRSASETSEDVLPQENKRRVTRTSTSSNFQHSSRKTKHPISPDIVSANRVRH